ncbi:MAG TPA: LuxR C-terminal-related transcriptional regulator [Chitinophagaceae bacterium]|nr:LuxR C-terminal-related transcriptional regulator [Chitinophagaceae bacterium]
MPGTQMYWTTLAFVCLELLILFYLLLYRAARPDDKAALLNIILLLLLITYNITGGLLPDPHLPGSFFLQNCIAYATGFITPCYFPYYVYKGFQLEKMRFHAYRGVFLCLVLPYFVFVTVFFTTGNLEDAKYILIIPVLYALWVLHTLSKAIRFKYRNVFNNRQFKVEMLILFLSLAPWVGLPFITFYNLNQTVEVTTTNSGFLLMMGLHLHRNVHRLRHEHKRLLESEEQLLGYDERLKEELEKLSSEREKISADERFYRNCERYLLTRRETEIARLIYQGLTYKTIGELLFIAEGTVGKHAQNIFEKAGASSRIELCRKLDELSSDSNPK